MTFVLRLLETIRDADGLVCAQIELDAGADTLRLLACRRCTPSHRCNECESERHRQWVGLDVEATIRWTLTMRRFPARHVFEQRIANVFVVVIRPERGLRTVGPLITRGLQPELDHEGVFKIEERLVRCRRLIARSSHVSDHRKGKGWNVLLGDRDFRDSKRSSTAP